MGYTCDFCGDQRSMVYCRSDAACLCLSCDRNVHSANALSKRHSRTLLCERCSSQPAFVRCSEEKVSLCQNCDWLGHGSSTSSSTHRKQTINCYSGCPSSEELSSIWLFVLDIPSMSGSSCEQELGLLSINENSNMSSWVPPENQNGTGSDQVNDQPDKDKSWDGASSKPESSTEPPVLEHPAGTSNQCLPKFYCPGTIGVIADGTLRHKEDVQEDDNSADQALEDGPTNQIIMDELVRQRGELADMHAYMTSRFDDLSAKLENFLPRDPPAG